MRRGVSLPWSGRMLGRGSLRVPAATARDGRPWGRGRHVRATDEGLVCLCHGSVFDLADGSAVHGPATEPLTPVGVAVRGTDVVLT